MIGYADWVHIYGMHKSQGILDLKRIICDSSTKRSALDLVLNDQTPSDEETEITVGTAKGEFKRYIYNLRATFPHTILLLVLVNIEA